MQPDGLLAGDFLAHYRDVLAHPTFDDWWRARTLSAEELASIDIPTLVVSGNFDLGIGPLTLWRGLEACNAGAERRHLLIGPWDHGQCYSGGGSRVGPYDLGDDSVIDLGALRIAFFDQHLKRQGHGPELRGRVTVFITGANRWCSFDAFPPREVTPLVLHLASGGRANSARGDGRLHRDPLAGAQPADTFVDDPTLPHISTMLEATGRSYDLRERERDHETLVYDSDVLSEPLTLLGEPCADLYTAADAPDADLLLLLAEHRADGSTIQLAAGQLRLRYRAGFETERLLSPGDPVQVRVSLTYVGHQVPAGSSLRLLIAGNNFPYADPNPHTGEPIGIAAAMRPCVQTLFTTPRGLRASPCRCCHDRRRHAFRTSKAASARERHPRRVQARRWRRLHAARSDGADARRCQVVHRADDSRGASPAPMVLDRTPYAAAKASRLAPSRVPRWSSMPSMVN